jgi:spore germination protein
MAYDHARDGSEAGSVAPLEWVEDVLAFAVSQVPAERVSLGIAAYGYDWVGTSGTAVSWDEAMALARQHDAVVRWGDRSASS